MLKILSSIKQTAEKFANFKVVDGYYCYDILGEVDSAWKISQFRKDRIFAVFNPSFKPRAVFFDMDSTLVEEETIVELAKSTGKEKYVDEVTEACMRGEMDFAEGLRKRVVCLKGAPESIFQTVRMKMRLTNGVEDLLKYLKKSEIPYHLVSGGFAEVADPLAKQLGFESVLANHLEVKEGFLTGNLAGDLVDSKSKENRLVEVAKEMNISRREIIAVGDGANDIPMLDAAGFSVGFRPKVKLYDHINLCNGLGDHRALIAILKCLD